MQWRRGNLARGVRSARREGLYAKARAGKIPNFTGVSSPYEVPENPDIVVDTSAEPLEESVERIVSFLLG